MRTSTLLAALTAALPVVFALEAAPYDASSDLVFRSAPMFDSAEAGLTYSTGFNLFARQSGNCSLSQVDCMDGSGCCKSGTACCSGTQACCTIGTDCCLGGCCQAGYSCDERASAGEQPCVCRGASCPDPESGSGGGRGGNNTSSGGRSATASGGSATSSGGLPPPEPTSTLRSGGPDSSSGASSSSGSDTEDASETDPNGGSVLTAMGYGAVMAMAVAVGAFAL